MTQTLEKKKYSIKTDFSLLSILLIPIGVALNVVGDQLVAALSLPLYLDSFGAVLAGYLAGPWVGMLTGVLTNVLTGIIRNPTLLPYAITNGCTGLMAERQALEGCADAAHYVCRHHLHLCPHLCLCIRRHFRQRRLLCGHRGSCGSGREHLEDGPQR